MDISKYNAIIFDLDGTLYDKRFLHIRIILADLINFFTLKSERYARRDLNGVDFKDKTGVYQALFAKMCELTRGLTPEKARKWYFDRYMPLQVAILSLYYKPRPCVDEVMRVLRDKGVKILLYSDYDCVREKTEALNIDLDLFDVVVSSPELGGLKPCRQSVERLMQQNGLSAETTLFVGDRNDTDGDAASSVGMDFYNVKTQGWDDFLRLVLNI